MGNFAPQFPTRHGLACAASQQCYSVPWFGGPRNTSSVALTFSIAEVEKNKTGQRRLTAVVRCSPRRARRTGTLLRTSRRAAYRPLAHLCSRIFSASATEPAAALDRGRGGGAGVRGS